MRRHTPSTGRCAFWTNDTIFMDSTVAIGRIRPDAIGPGQRFAVATMEVCFRILSRDNEVAVRWVPAHHGATGNERAGECAKAVAGGSPGSEVSDEYRWDTSLSRMSRMATEARPVRPPSGVSSYVEPESPGMGITSQENVGGHREDVCAPEGPPRSSGYGRRRQWRRSWPSYGIPGSFAWSR